MFVGVDENIVRLLFVVVTGIDGTATEFCVSKARRYEGLEATYQCLLRLLTRSKMCWKP